MKRSIATVAVCAAIAAAGCGQDSAPTPDPDSQVATTPSQTQPDATAPTQPPGSGSETQPGAGSGSAKKPPKASVQVIKHWTDRLRHGDVKGASATFDVPAIVQNGTPPITLHRRSEVNAFNRSLPCGARLLDTQRDGSGVIGIFRLTERPGGQCGQGTGQRAATRFVIKKGKIVEWKRVDDPTGGAAGGTV